MSKTRRTQTTYNIAFSGHRSSDAPGRSMQELEACRPLIKQAFQTIQGRISPQGGRLHFISSLAEGADMIAIEVAQSLGITSQMLLPLPVEQFRDDFADRPEAWAKALQLIEEAKQIGSRVSLDILNPPLGRPNCYAMVNEKMLASSDVLIALWNELPVSGVGGTAQVWQQAEAKHLARIHINPIKLKSLSYDLEQLETNH